MCNSKAGLREALNRYVNEEKTTQYISINCHGSEHGLDFLNGDKVSRAEVRNILKLDEENRSLVGLHFGSCFFGTHRLASFLYQTDISPWWIAGYGEKVDFVKSTLLDLFFFNSVLEHKRKEPVQAIKLVSKHMQETALGLCEELRFSIFVENGDEEVIDLLSS